MQDRFSRFEFLNSITWYAVDDEMSIGAFGMGHIPDVALRWQNDWSWVDDIMFGLPQSSEYKLLEHPEIDAVWASARDLTPLGRDHLRGTLKNSAGNSMAELPRRGIFQFNGEPAPLGILPAKFLLRAFPTKPLKLNDVPETAERITETVRLPTRFGSITQLDILRVAPHQVADGGW
jgi:hypothetical protein